MLGRTVFTGWCLTVGWRRGFCPEPRRRRPSKEARHEVRRMAMLMRHPWMAHHFPVGVRCHVPSPLRSVEQEEGLLWAAPQVVVGTKNAKIVLLRRGPHRGAVDDLEAAISRRWTVQMWSTPWSER